MGTPAAHNSERCANQRMRVGNLKAHSHSHTSSWYTIYYPIRSHKLRTQELTIYYREMKAPLLEFDKVVHIFWIFKLEMLHSEIRLSIINWSLDVSQILSESAAFYGEIVFVLYVLIPLTQSLTQSLTISLTQSPLTNWVYYGQVIALVVTVVATHFNTWWLLGATVAAVMHSQICLRLGPGNGWLLTHVCVWHVSGSDASFLWKRGDLWSNQAGRNMVMPNADSGRGTKGRNTKVQSVMVFHFEQVLRFAERKPVLNFWVWVVRVYASIQFVI